MTHWAISPWETRKLEILGLGDDQDLLWNCGQLCIMSFINSYVGTGTSKTSETAKFFSPSPLLDTWDDRSPSWWSLQNEQLSSLGCFRFGTGDAKSDVLQSEILWFLLPSASLADSLIVSHCTILGNGGARRICARVHIYIYIYSILPQGPLEPSWNRAARSVDQGKQKLSETNLFQKRNIHEHVYIISYHIILL